MINEGILPLARPTLGMLFLRALLGELNNLFKPLIFTTKSRVENGHWQFIQQIAVTRIRKLVTSRSKGNVQPFLLTNL